jgi:8-oxo-dGTP pyrophosphatase MutT (NUDIX family)
MDKCLPKEALYKWVKLMADLASLTDGSRDEASLTTLQTQALQDGRMCVVGALIVNPEGQVFVQQRALDSHFLPGCWDIVGGHVEPGETLVGAMAREIQEETGWQLQHVIKLVAIIDWETIGLESSILKREFDFLVFVKGDLSQPQLEWDKVMAYQWLGQAQVELVQENRQPTGQKYMAYDWAIGITLKE